MKWEMKLREEREASEAKGMKKGLEKGLKQGLEQGSSKKKRIL